MTLVAFALAGARPSHAADCASTLHRAGTAAYRAQMKQIIGCLKDFAKAGGGVLPPATECFVLDEKGKIQKKEDAIAKKAAKPACDPPPAFGTSGADNIGAAARALAVGAAIELFGPRLNDVVVPGGRESTCRNTLGKRTDRLLRVDLKAFRKCMKSPAAGTRAGLRACLAQVTADSSGRHAAQVAGLASDLSTGRCGGVDLATAAPGGCAGAADRASCIERRLRCQVCRYLDAVHDLGADCETFDDGAANDSCDARYPQMFRNLLALPATGTTYYVSDTCGDNANDGLSPACGQGGGQGPWKDLSPLMSLTLGPGDAVAIRGGTYHTGKQTLDVSPSGSPTEPIRFYAYKGETVVIDGDWGQPPDPPLVPGDTSSVLRVAGRYLVFDGLEIRGCNMTCILIHLGARSVLRGLRVIGGGEDGIKTSHAYTDLVMESEFTGFHNEALDVWHSSDFWLIDNEIHDNDTSLRDPSTGVWTKGGSRNVYLRGNRFHDLVVAEHALMLGGCCWQNWDDIGGLIQEKDGTVTPQPVARQVRAVGNVIEDVVIDTSAPDAHAYSSALGITGCHHCEASGNRIDFADVPISVSATNGTGQPCYPGADCQVPGACSCQWQVEAEDIDVADNIVKAPNQSAVGGGSQSARIASMTDAYSGHAIDVDGNAYCSDAPPTFRIGPAGASSLDLAGWQSAGFDVSSLLTPEALCPWFVDPRVGLAQWGLIDDAYALNEPQLASSGAQEIWINVDWSGVFSLGGDFWTLLDAAIDGATDQGVAVALKLRTGQSHPGVVDPGGSSPGASWPLDPSDPGAYYDWVSQIASRYQGRVRAYAIENEVSATKFWAGSWADYVVLLELASQAIRTSDAQATIVDFGMPSPAYGLAIAREDYEASGDVAATIAWLTDYFGQRGSRYWQSQGWTVPANQAELEALLYAPDIDDDYQVMLQHFTVLDLVDAYQLHYYESWKHLPRVIEWIRNKMRAAGSIRPIEAWELGYAWYDDPAGVPPHGYDEAAHARDAGKLLATAAGEGISRMHYLPYWSNDVAHGKEEVHWALVASDYTPRQALSAFQTAAALTAGRRHAQRLDLGPGQWGYDFDGLRLTWTETGDVVVSGN